MEKISEAVVDKVKVEAKGLIAEAEKEAQGAIEKAQKQRETRIAEEKRRMLVGAEEEAARIVAQGTIKGRQKLSSAKAGMIDEVVEKAKKKLSGTSSPKTSLLALTREALSGIGTDKVRIYVSPKDLSLAQEIVKENKDLSSRIEEIKDYDCMGGVIVENTNGRISIDNTYETRLEMLLPKILPEVNKELFGVV